MATTLMLYNWRCFAQASFSIPEKSFALVDENGAGKSTLLSAAYSLYTGQSWPGTKLAENLRLGSHYFGVLTDRPDWSFAGQTGYNGRVNARYQRPQDVEEWPRVFTYSPDDNYWLSLPRNIKLTRLDHLIARINGDYLELISALDKYVRAKQKALKQSGTVDLRMIIVLTRAIHDLSVKVWEVRRGFLKYIEGELEEFCDWIDSPLSEWHVTYEITDGNGVRRRIENVDSKPLSEGDIERLWRKEQTIGKIMYGAQRDEFQFESGRVRAQNSLSRGENRLLTLFVKYLTQKKVLEVHPAARIWWLLDDVYNELDTTREDILQKKVLDIAEFSIYSGTRGPKQKTPVYRIDDLRLRP